MAKVKSSFQLSVILRTQLKHLDCLEDALLCLSAQIDTNFELIIVLHGASGLKELEAIVGMQIETLKKRVKILQVIGGNRGVPLNEGIRASKGTHIAFFDDDDILTSGWVAEFHRSALQHPNSILRSQVATLNSCRTVSNSGNEIVLQTARPIADYNSDFVHVDHFLVSHTPFMALCFPSELFFEYGVSCDEDLVVCEDWDLLLRSANLMKVVNIPILTAFYRRWEGQESSYSINSERVWRDSENKVLDKLSLEKLVIPGTELYRIRHLLELEKEWHYLKQAAEEKNLMEKSISWKLTAPLRRARKVFSNSSNRVN